MASAQAVEMSVTNSSPSQDSNHPDDLFQSKSRKFLIFVDPRMSLSNMCILPPFLIFAKIRFYSQSILHLKQPSAKLSKIADITKKQESKHGVKHLI